MENKIKKALIILSISLNVVCGLVIISNLWLFPSKGLGRLEKDINVGIFAGDTIRFTLPKGLTVRDASMKGLGAMGQFENERFEIVVTSDDNKLVKYGLPKDSLDYFGNMYSANRSYNKNK